ncbi:hypothetical protein HFO60_20965 [Rhizobium leguminosarum]|uniref:hypothetical protein n=1 Tax=Rhizobium leguminosarum TaxID=384 RepID=UPI001C954463|nr:hypothetical protein [Rhizobium leguminosarum]MBY5542462.1 hypothetical protein [Rhizobium leguminosarum]
MKSASTGSSGFIGAGFFIRNLLLALTGRSSAAAKARDLAGAFAIDMGALGNRQRL